jgi:alcohol dehydrogenase class IV
MQAIWKFLTPRQVVFGTESSLDISHFINETDAKKYLIVTGKVVRAAGLLSSLEKTLSGNNKSFVIYDGIEGEPVVENVEAGLKYFNENYCEEIIALGGGSPLDTAKLISVMVTNEGRITDYRGVDKIPNRGVRVIALPTTAGTGSEVTRYAAVIDKKTSEKMLLTSQYLIADTAIVDPSLTVSCPGLLSAATGVDALTHAIEAFVSAKANPASDIFAIKAIKLISASLRDVLSDGRNMRARENVMLGSMYAGIAFSNASVALVHGMSRPIGGFFGIGHGLSNAALLRNVMEFSYLGNIRRYKEIAEAMGEKINECMTAEQAAELSVKAVGELIADLKIPSLKEMGVDKKKLSEVAGAMAEAAIASGSPGNNPKPATKEEMMEIYFKSYE